jgi:hypothetical protein
MIFGISYTFRTEKDGFCWAYLQQDANSLKEAEKRFWEYVDTKNFLTVKLLEIDIPPKEKPYSVVFDREKYEKEI